MAHQHGKQLISAERRNFTERRRVCLLDYIHGDKTLDNLRSGLDRRLAIKLLCSGCHKPLFATRDADRRLILSDRFSEYVSKVDRETYDCPACGAAVPKQVLQQQQDELLIGKLRFV